MARINIIFLLILTTFYSPVTIAQEIPVSTEQQLENQTDADQSETEDDAWLQDLEGFRKDQLNINIADADELRQLRLLSDLQIANLIAYRAILGRLQSIYELQSVPAWDIATIKKLLPFITVTGAVSLSDDMRKRTSGGEHSFLLRVSQVLETAKGYNAATTSTKYLGSPQRIFVRYRYNYKNLLQYGLVGDKDAGEQFFKGGQRQGFDFYSFHFFARKIGIIQSAAVGDFTVNLGQGLILWQNLAFKKSVDVMGVKRQSAVLRPYSSAGEFYFHRGAGITIRKGKIESTAFVSFRKLSANFVADTVNNEDYVSSLLSSGYHRTPSELNDRNKLVQTAAGLNIAYKTRNFHVGVNGIIYRFSTSVQKRNEPYNLHAIGGNSWHNGSVDYSYTFRNMHFFGEVAIDKNFNPAVITGLMMSVDPKVDISVIHRYISVAYQAVNGNAFTESAYPSNEKGVYAGITIRPATGLKIDAYCDFFQFPWLKYLVDAPSTGTDYLTQVTFTPNKQVEVYSRFRIESKQSNASGNTTTTNLLAALPRKSWRTQVSYRISPSITIKSRAELQWFGNNKEDNENGFLIFQDVIFKPLFSQLNLGARVQYFETDTYNSRIYAYENDVLYSYSIPSFFDKGIRYYINASYDLSKKITMWLRFARTVYPSKNIAGSGLDEIEGGHKTDVKLQIRYTL
ncbi:MAG: helix-hairpin-helix domain-containing protein [Chitinophagaceae bacterium]|nr:helix-hairpin-helix domain-containing protein [Chitinophagaceae bacterium]MBK8952409.1 helix-hairpin-helix domain-containing protein [Chitinophagaceae bacterium]